MGTKLPVSRLCRQWYFLMITQRLIAIINRRMPARRPFAELETLTGIDAQAWKHMASERTKLSAAQLEAICRLFPEYTLWLMTGNVNTDAGQTSPDIEALDELKKRVSA